MNNETWKLIPEDVREQMMSTPMGVGFDDSIPTGIVAERIAQPDGSIFTRQTPVAEFVSKQRRRAAKKSERQNKRVGRAHSANR